MFKFSDIMGFVWLFGFFILSIFTDDKIVWVFFGISVLWQMVSHVINELKYPNKK